MNQVNWDAVPHLRNWGEDLKASSMRVQRQLFYDLVAREGHHTDAMRTNRMGCYYSNYSNDFMEITR
jgi:hypothetical protein